MKQRLGDSGVAILRKRDGTNSADLSYVATYYSLSMPIIRRIPITVSSQRLWHPTQPSERSGDCDYCSFIERISFIVSFMMSTGSGAPVHSAKARAPWWTAILTPFIVAQPRVCASQSSFVLGGL